MPSTPPPSADLALRLALVGAGAVGSQVAHLLAQEGYRDVLLIDPGVLEPRNLLTSPLYQREAQLHSIIGLPKVTALAAFAARAHGLGWHTQHAEVADVGLGDLRDRDLILSCTDSALARIETTLAARTLRLPMLDAAVRSHGLTQGRVTCFSPRQQAACYLCGLSAPRRAELLAFALSASLSCTLPADPAPMSGTLTATAAVAAALLHYLARPQHSESFASIIDPGDPTPNLIRLTPSAECPWHNLPPLASMLTLAYDQPIATGHPALDLPWPLCLRALCRACGHVSTPARRTAFVRRNAICPSCRNTGTLDPMESLSTVRAHHPAAQRTPRQLGLPPNQLVTPRALYTPQDSPQ